MATKLKTEKIILLYNSTIIYNYNFTIIITGKKLILIKASLYRNYKTSSIRFQPNCNSIKINIPIFLQAKPQFKIVSLLLVRTRKIPQNLLS